MTELEFVWRSTKREPENVVAETNTEDRFLTDQTANRLVRIRKRRWIAGTVGKKNTIGIECERVFGGRGRRNNRDAESILSKPSQNIFFHSVIVRNDVRSDRR